MYEHYKLANLISKLNFCKFTPKLMAKRGPPNQPCIHLTRGHLRLEEQKRCYGDHVLKPGRKYMMPPGKMGMNQPVLAGWDWLALAI